MLDRSQLDGVSPNFLLNSLPGSKPVPVDEEELWREKLNLVPRVQVDLINPLILNYFLVSEKT